MGTIYYPSFADSNKFKVSLLHEEAASFGQHNSTKGLHQCCHKHQYRNLKAYLNTYYRESIFLSKGNSKIWSNYRNDNLENLEG